MNRSVLKTLVFCALVSALWAIPAKVTLVSFGLPKLEFSLLFASGNDDADDEQDDEDDDDDDADDADDDDDDDDDDADDEDDGEDGSDDETDDESNDDEQDSDEGDDGLSGSGDEGLAPEGETATASKSARASNYRPSGAILRIVVSKSGVDIRYADGGREEIQNGVFRILDPDGRTIGERRARGSDITRMKAIASSVSIRSVIRNGTEATEVESTHSDDGDLTVTYSNGWSEVLSNGKYRLLDSYSRPVVIRPASRSDEQRLRRLLPAS